MTGRQSLERPFHPHEIVRRNTDGGIRVELGKPSVHGVATLPGGERLNLSPQIWIGGG